MWNVKWDRTQKINISNKMGEGVQQWLARIVFCIFLSHRGGKARTIKPKYFKSDPIAHQRGNPAPWKANNISGGSYLGGRQETSVPAERWWMPTLNLYGAILCLTSQKSRLCIIWQKSFLLWVVHVGSYVNEKPNRLTLTPGLKQFINSYGAATSKIDSAGATNGVENEKFYGSLWRTIQLLMADAKAPIKTGTCTRFGLIPKSFKQSLVPPKNRKYTKKSYIDITLYSWVCSNCIKRNDNSNT